MSDTTNPRFLTVSNDDVLWIYDYDPTKTYDHNPISDPDDFFDEYVFTQPKACMKPLHPYTVVVDSADANKPKIQFSGMCGTPTIMASGYNEPEIAAFSTWRTALKPDGTANGDDWSAFIAETRQLPVATPAATVATADPFWQTCEDELSIQKHRKGGVDFVFLTLEGKLIVHLELGSSADFRTRFKAASAKDGDGLRHWLTNGGTKIGRYIYELGASGIKAAVSTVTPASVELSGGDVQTFSYMDDINCLDPACPYLSACTVGTGDITTFDSTGGVAKASLDMMGQKPYCADAEGNPCPD